MKECYLIGGSTAGADALTTIRSVPGEFGDFVAGAIEVDFPTGTPNGTLTLYASNKSGPASSYKLITGSSQAVARGEGHLYDIPECGYRYVAVQWAPTAFTDATWARTAGSPAVNNAAWALVATATGDTYTAAPNKGTYTVTVTSAGHHLITGAVITVSGGSEAAVDGAHTITKTGADTFTFNVATDPTAAGTLDYTTGAIGVAYTAEGAGPYTVTVTSAAHGLLTGAVVEVANGSDSDVDGAQTVTVVDVNTFTFSIANDPTAAGTLDWSISATTVNYAAVEDSPPWLVTVTTAAPHGLTTADSIRVFSGSDSSVDGLQTITKTGDSEFTFEVVTDPTASGTLNWAKAPYTVEVTSNSHAVLSGQTLLVSDSHASLNGNRVATKTGDNTFTLPAAGDVGAAIGTLDYVGTSFTVQVAATAHGYLTADVVQMANGNDAGTPETAKTMLDGAKTITKVNDNAFSYIVATDPGASGEVDISGGVGTITAQFSLKNK